MLGRRIGKKYQFYIFSECGIMQLINGESLTKKQNEYMYIIHFTKKGKKKIMNICTFISLWTVALIRFF